MADETPAWIARKLLRAARTATLATANEGQPFASLITPATAPDLSVLMLLSDLSEHTRELRRDPRCAILVTGEPESPNPQTAPRLTITGLAEIDPDPALKTRWLAIHPYAALYADFGDFNLWRVRPMGGLFVGGFARATRLRADDLTPNPQSVTALQEAEQDICTHCNHDHPDTLTLLAGTKGEWQMITADVDGCDLTNEEVTIRIAWRTPVASANDVRKELISLSKAARETSF